ncbi:MAG: DUF2793 domain-containing protein [Methylobacterium frigidaeris]
MTEATPLLALPLLAAAQAQKHVTHNEALTALDTLVQLAVLDKDRTAPPAGPAEGDRYLVASAAPTDAWSGWAGRVVRFQDGAWLSFVPRPGWVAYVADEDALYAYGAGASPGTGAWTMMRAAAATLQNLSRLGVGTTADAANPFAARLNAALWTALGKAEGGTGDLRYTLDKEAPANTLSLLFQSGWSGRAELGLTGDDDWRLKVSADGASWREALRVERASGGLDFLAAETTLASAATLDLGAAPTLKVAITGSATVTSFGTSPNRVRLLRFTGALTLTHAAGLVLPRGANLVTAAGDTGLAVSDDTGAWRLWSYQRATGRALAGPASAEIADATATGRAALTAASAAALARAAGLGPEASPSFVRATLNANATATASLPAAPGGSAMRLVGADGALSVISAEAYGGQAFFTLRRASGTAAAPTATRAGDAMGLFGAGGYVAGSGFADYTGRLNFTAAEDFTAGAQGTVVSISACRRGSTAQTPVMWLDPDSGVRPGPDNLLALGAAASRWSQLYAGTGTIGTSDAREKTAVAPLSPAELAAARDLAREVGTFRFLSAIAAKGEAARLHVGLTVQRAVAILEGHGLDPFAYAFVCRDAWPASPGRAEVREDVLDEAGTPTGETRVVQAAEPARPAGERLGFRADQLALFLLRGQEQRLAALEAAHD